MMHAKIRTTAYETNPDSGPWWEQFEVWTLPEEWHAPLLALYRHGWSDPDRPVSLPTRQLNVLLQAMAPGVVAVGGVAREGQGQPWLYAREAIPEPLIRGLLNTWIMGLRPGPEHEEQTLRALEATAAHAPRRSIERVRLDARTLTAGGTAEPPGSLYALLPELLAVRLAARKFTSEQEPLSFRVAGREQGAELVSWPPRRHPAKGRDWFYSAVIAITLQTVPFGVPPVHVSYGIRRWATRPPVLPVRKRVHVLLDVPLPWARDGERANILVPNTIAFDPKRGELAWIDRSVVDLIPDLDVVRSYPEAKEVVTDAEAWLRGRGDVAAGVLYHAATHRDHGVGPGLMPVERALLDAWVADGLQPLLRRVPDYVRVFGRSNKPRLLPKIPKADIERRAAAAVELADQRRSSLAGIVGPERLEALVLWQNTETRDQLLADLAESFGLPGQAANEDGRLTLERDGVLVDVRCVPLPEHLGSALAIAPGPRNVRAKAVSAAIQARRDAMAAHVGTVRSAAKMPAVFVELDGHDAFEDDRDSDPKVALRWGCADADAVSQFIQTPERAEGSLEMRSRSAVHDLLRQCGLIAVPQHTVGPLIAENTQYLALWYVRRTAAGPSRRADHRLVALRVRPGDATAPVCGWDGDAKSWLPYPEFLVGLARGGNRLSSSGDPADGSRAIADVRAIETERQIRTLLYQARDRPTVLLASMGNLRSVWRGLRISALVRDELHFQDQSAKRLALYGPELSVVLARDANGRHEIPEWYALGEKPGEEGFAAGLWQPTGAGPDQRVFLSTADAAFSAKGLRRDLRKLVPLQDWPDAPAKFAWNPNALELTVLGCSEKILAAAPAGPNARTAFVQLASLVHQLRFTNGCEPLALPLPLHLAKLAAEYV